MQSHSQFSDKEFLNAFKDCKFDPAKFTHEAHLRLAYINIDTYGIKKAEKEIQFQIENYVSHIGASDKYNATLTVAALKTVNHFMKKSQSDNFQDFVDEFPRLKNNFRDLLFQHYSFDIFNSKKAKEKYLEPDLLTFD